MFELKNHFKNEDDDAKVIFVQDFLLSDLVGGAELSMDALHKSSPVDYAIIRSQEVNQQFIDRHKNKHWVFGNFAGLNPQFIVYAMQNLSYSVYEHDYKFCKYRSIEKHELLEGKKCDCNASQLGQLVKNFYMLAKKVWWCSSGQLNRYLSFFPELKNANNEVLSAVFGQEFFDAILPLVNDLPNRKKSGWLTLSSDSWIKGTEDAIKWLNDSGKQYSFIKNMTPQQVLEAFANAEGFVCLPRGGDVSNRMVTEAKLLGCEVVCNENVQHYKEEWLNLHNKFDTIAWLSGRRKVFWDKTLTLIDKS